jgi:hypothetical protein
MNNPLATFCSMTGEKNVEVFMKYKDTEGGRASAWWLRALTAFLPRKRPPVQAG